MLERATKFINRNLSEQMLISEMGCNKNVGFVNIVCFVFSGLIPGYERET